MAEQDMPQDLSMRSPMTFTTLEDVPSVRSPSPPLRQTSKDVTSTEVTDPPTTRVTSTSLVKAQPKASTEQESQVIQHGISETGSVTPPAPAKRKPGRQKGSKNKKTTEAKPTKPTKPTKAKKPKVLKINKSKNKTPEIATMDDATVAAGTWRDDGAGHEFSTSPMARSGQLFANRHRYRVPTPSPPPQQYCPMSEDEEQEEHVPSDGEIDEDCQDAEDAESGQSGPKFTEDLQKALIQAIVPLYAAYRTAHNTAIKRKVFETAMRNVTLAGFRPRDIPGQLEVMKRFAKLKDRYKKVQDNNKRTGQKPMHFKFTDTFAEAYGQSRSLEIDFPTDESVEAHAPEGVDKRARPKSKNSGPARLDIMERELEARNEFHKESLQMEKERNMIEREKLEILRQLLRSMPPPAAPAQPATEPFADPSDTPKTPRRKRAAASSPRRTSPRTKSRCPQ